MTLFEFEQQVFQIALASQVCDIPVVRRLTATSINLRVNVTLGGFIDVFYNELTGTTAFALIVGDRRVFGADNAGGWHVHPFESPEQHIRMSGEMSFAEFVTAIKNRVVLK